MSHSLIPEKMFTISRLKKRLLAWLPFGITLSGGSWIYKHQATNDSSGKPNDENEYIYLPKHPDEAVCDIDKLNELNQSQHQSESLTNQLISKYHSTLAMIAEIEALKSSQTTNYEASIQLARTPLVNSDKLRPPIKSDPIVLNLNGIVHHFKLEELMIHLLRSVAKIEGQSECAKYFSEQALVVFDQSDISLNDIFFHEDHHHRPKVHDRSYIERHQGLYFQTILQNLICGKEHTLCLVENGLLLLLHRLRETYFSKQVQYWIATCLSTLSAYKETHLHLYDAGWMRILAQWLNSPDYHLKLEAAKTLYNMAHRESLHKSIYILNPIYNSTVLHTDCDIIFIHGLKGGVLKTWRQLDTMKLSVDYTYCWPKSWLGRDFNHCRILAVNYESFLSNWNINCSSDMYTLKDRSLQLEEELRLADVGKRPIIWVTHSMGGLMVKHILCHLGNTPNQDRSLLDQTKGVVFYSVPHRGSEMAVWSQNIERIISPTNHVLELRKDCHSLLELHGKFVEIALRSRIECLSFGETKKCTLIRKPIEWKSLLVPEESANPGIGKFIVLEENHFNTCKPKDQDSQSYKELKEFLCKLIKNKTNQKETFENSVYLNCFL